MPPTNIHVLIGRNGVGKTRLLSEIAESIIEEKNKNYPAIEGQILFLDEDKDSAKFSSLITMGFSPFDAFLPLTKYKISKKNIEEKIYAPYKKSNDSFINAIIFRWHNNANEKLLILKALFKVKPSL